MADLAAWRAGEAPAAVPEVLRATPWQMSFGERAAFEGLLSQCKPRLALELGRAEGGSLERMAIHCDEVHSIDLSEPSEESRSLENVQLHTGDSHALLPELLAGFAAAGRNVDFVLVDGDHSADGVRRDVTDLLDSEALARTLIVLHDTMNEQVRSGIASARPEAVGKVVYVHLDFVPGYVLIDDPAGDHLWGGLGLIVVDAAGDAAARVAESRYADPHPILVAAKALVLRGGGRPAGSGRSGERRFLRRPWHLLLARLPEGARMRLWRARHRLPGDGR
jgi:Methyltransferase domain